jgi:hypothetical protein
VRGTTHEPADWTSAPSLAVSFGVPIEKMAWKNEAQRRAVEREVVESRDVHGGDGTVFVSALAVAEIPGGAARADKAGEAEKEGKEGQDGDEKGKKGPQWKGAVLGMRCVVNTRGT